MRPSIAGLLAAALLTLAAADQHILLDTTKETMLDWTRYPYGPQSPTPGWVEESFTNFEKGINWRSYVVCDVGYQGGSSIAFETSFGRFWVIFWAIFGPF